MSLTVSESTSFKSVTPGTYPARCIRLIDIGTQEGEYNGKKIVKKQIIIAWELPSELIEGGDYDGQPYMVSRFYTASLHEKAALRKDLEAWRGRAFTADELKGFSLKNILDKPCMLSVIHSESGKAKVGGVMALPKGLVVADRINPLVHFDLTDWIEGGMMESELTGLTDGIKKLIKESHEYKHGNDFIDNPPDDTTELEPF